MKKILLIISIISGAFATDYSTLTNDELFNLRGTIDSENKTIFQDEMKSRMQSLTPEERSTVRSTRSSTGTTTRQRLNNGSGTGNMYRGSRGRR